MEKETTFRALPPLLGEPRAPRVVDLDSQGAPRRAHRAPADGPRVLRAIVAGPRLVLTPASLRAARDLENGRATSGSRYDHQARTRTFHLDRALRHGGVRIEDALLAAELAGLTIELDPTATAHIARRRRNHERQIRPIPRAIWRDENESTDGEITADQRLGGTHRR